MRISSNSLCLKRIYSKQDTTDFHLASHLYTDDSLRASYLLMNAKERSRLRVSTKKVGTLRLVDLLTSIQSTTYIDVVSCKISLHISTKSTPVYAIFLQDEAHAAFGDTKATSRLCSVASTEFYGLDNEFTLKTGKRGIQSGGWTGTSRLRRLQTWRKMIGMDDSIGAQNDCPLNTILELAHIPWPVVCRQEIDRRTRDSQYAFAGTSSQFFGKMVG
jgi:hypothetical protein